MQHCRDGGALPRRVVALAIFPAGDKVQRRPLRPRAALQGRNLEVGLHFRAPKSTVKTRPSSRDAYDSSRGLGSTKMGDGPLPTTRSRFTSKAAAASL